MIAEERQVLEGDDDILGFGPLGQDGHAPVRLFDVANDPGSTHIVSDLREELTVQWDRQRRFAPVEGPP
jgi:hypothetical protein